MEFINSPKLPNDNEYLWRYMDIHKFMSLLNIRKVRFSRMDQFEDPLEGIPFEILMMANRMGTDFNLSDALLNRIQPIIPADHTSLSSRTGQIVKIQSTHFVSCWFYETTESMAMWNLYSNENGIALKIKFSDLKNCLHPDLVDSEIVDYYCGKVNYQNFNNNDIYSEQNLKKIKRLALRKDKSYSHEHEIRFVVKTKNSNNLKGINSKILNLENLDFQVLSHPKMQNWKIDNIIALLELKKLKDRFMPSQIRIR